MFNLIVIYLCLGQVWGAVVSLSLAISDREAKKVHLILSYVVNTLLFPLTAVPGVYWLKTGKTLKDLMKKGQ